MTLKTAFWRQHYVELHIVLKKENEIKHVNLNNTQLYEFVNVTQTSDYASDSVMT